ncbi:MAG: hypothetical protein AAF544_12415 [Bacteroidota bacterium]
MSQSGFFRGLAITTGLAALAALGFHMVERISSHWPLSLGAIILYAVLSIGMYYIGDRTAKAKNKHLFTNVTIGFTLLKMLTSAGIIVIYLLIVEPDDKLFVLPFFVIYFLYTAFELLFMIKVARG